MPRQERERRNHPDDDRFSERGRGRYPQQQQDEYRDFDEGYRTDYGRGRGQQSGFYGDPDFDTSAHDQFGQSHYVPESRYRSRQYGAGLTPGYSDNPNDEQDTRGRAGRYQGGYENWTPQYQQPQQQRRYDNDPYDQRRADAYQSAPYNPRRDEYGPDYGYGQSGGYGRTNPGRSNYGQSGGYGRAQSGRESSNDPNRYSNPYGDPYGLNPGYRGERDSGEYGRSADGYGRESWPQQSYAGRGPKGYKRSDDRIKEEVCDALMHAGHIDCSDIEVSVSDGEVTLKGEVARRHDRREIEDIAERVLGVKDVQLQLKVKQQQGGRSESGSQSSSSSSSGYSSGKSDDANGNAKSASQKETKPTTAGSAR